MESARFVLRIYYITYFPTCQHHFLTLIQDSTSYNHRAQPLGTGTALQHNVTRALNIPFVRFFF